MAIPQDIMAQTSDIAAGMDAAMAEGAQIMTPRGKFSARAMNALVQALNEVLPMMGRTDMYPEFTDDLTEFPQDLVQLLMGLMTVASTAGVELDMDLGAMVSDKDVAKLAALIKRMKGDKRLQDYLAQAEEPIEVSSTEMVEVEEPMKGSAPQGKNETDELFMSRMG